MFEQIERTTDMIPSPTASQSPEDIGQNTILDPVSTESPKKEETAEKKEENTTEKTEKEENEKESDIPLNKEENSFNKEINNTDSNQEEKSEEDQTEEDVEGDQQMNNESSAGGTFVSMSGGGGGGVIDMGGTGDMGDMTGTEQETASILSPLSSVPHMLEITGITAVLGIIIGVLLAVKKIKKGFELYED